MSLLSRLFRTKSDPREKMRPLWHKIVEIARDERWYTKAGVTDSVSGRFDMITVILSLTILRMEKEDALVGPSAFLAELFVEDMDGQLRESGVGDVVMGKHIGRLMAVLGGRLGALRDGLADESEARLVDAVARNVTLNENVVAGALAQELRAFADRLSSHHDDAILAGEIGL